MLTLLLLLRTIEFARYIMMMMMIMIGSADEIKNMQNLTPDLPLRLLCRLAYYLLDYCYIIIIIKVPFKKYPENPILKDSLYL